MHDYLRVIILAQEEARLLVHNVVGTEQLLLGLIREDSGRASQVLTSMGIQLTDARNEVESIVGRGSGFVAIENPFTPNARQVLDCAVEIADRTGCQSIDTEHLLLGLIEHREGVAIQVLQRLNVNVDYLSDAIRR